MARIALWTFDSSPRSQILEDTEISDGAAQDGVLVGGATTDGAGAGVFDGVNDYAEVPHEPAFDLKTGSIVITFTQDTASVGDNPYGNAAAQTLFSRDAYGYGSGDDLTIYVKSDGSVGVRHQSADDSHYFSGGDVVLGQPTTVIYSWGPSGSQLVVDGTVVDAGKEALSMAGDPQPIVIGATQAQSDRGDADVIQGHFDGTISGVAIHDAPVSVDTVPCFVRGTQILTPDGPVPIEQLRVGDLVTTWQRGPQPLRWVGSSCVELGGGCQANDKLRPVRIVAGALGQGLPQRDLWVSRQHRMLSVSKVAKRLLKHDCALISAAKLTALPGVFVDHDPQYVEYFHLMFDQHEVVFAENAPSESFYAGEGALNALPKAARMEILTLFPRLEQWKSAPTPAALLPSGQQQAQLVARHVQNCKPLLQTYARAYESLHGH